MNEDFNPFDVSSTGSASKQEVKETSVVKPTVHKVGMGPIFHSQFTKIIAFILSFILAGLLGYVGMNLYLTKKSASNNRPYSASISSITA